MDINKNYYETLGITPSAELAVIKAVYKALANKYHPDKNIGNAAQAEVKMRQINEAYEVLSDSSKRAAYDAARNKADEAVFEETEETLQSAEDLLAELIEKDWAVAEKYHPDVKACVEKLNRISRSLVLPFKIYVLNEQLFSKAKQIGNLMVEDYLRSYFGKDETILQYAYELLVDGDREAARELNRAIRVLGKDVQPEALIQSIDEEYQTEHLEREQEALEERREKDRRVKLANEKEQKRQDTIFYIWVFLIAGFMILIFLFS